MLHAKIGPVHRRQSSEQVCLEEATKCGQWFCWCHVFTSSGRSFHVCGPATGKARLPTVDSLLVGTTRRLVSAEHSDRRLGRWSSTYALQHVNRWLFRNISSARVTLRHCQSLALWLSMLCHISHSTRQPSKTFVIHSFIHSFIHDAKRSAIASQQFNTRNGSASIVVACEMMRLCTAVLTKSSQERSTVCHALTAHETLYIKDLHVGGRHRCSKLTRKII